MTVPLQVDGRTIRDGRVEDARVIDGELEVRLSGVPAIWARLYDRGAVSLDLSVTP